MKKRSKKRVPKREKRRSLLGLFRRAPTAGDAAAGAPELEPESPGLEDAARLAESEPPDSTSSSEQTRTFATLRDAPSPVPPRSAEERAIPTTARLPIVTDEELAAAQRAAQAYQDVSKDLRRRAQPRRPSGTRRVAEVRPRRREGGFFTFVFSVIGLIIRMVIVLVLVGALGAVVGYEAVRLYVRTPEVVVPNVKGMKLPDAFDTLGQKKLGLLKERVEPNSLVAPGEIIEQKPPPGTKAKEGTVVRVVVSSGRANYIVPDVIGERRENAENKIRGAGLEVGDISYLESETVPRDCVISQNPEPNKGLEQPAPVHLLLSKGPPRSSASSSLPAPSSASTSQ
jgi:hypothetical protein